MVKFDLEAGERFYSAALDDEHLWACLRYVERNPVRAKITRRAWTYPWSSAAVHTGRAKKGDPLVDVDWWAKSLRGLDWAKHLCEPEDDAIIARLRSNTHTGRPLGSDSFLSKLERRLGRRLRPLPVGRPKRSVKRARQRRRG